MAREASRGVFWVVDDQLLAFPFYDAYEGNGIAKAGNTFNHKKLWQDVKPAGCSKPYNYYPRGRVDLTAKGSVIFLNPRITAFVPDIKVAFGLRDEPRVILDGSDHYKCSLDEGWKPDR